MRFGSLFAGIGGLDLGFERAGFECAWQVENNEFCQRVLAKHWPDVPKYGDITTLDTADLERVDVVVGGFPCQPVSVAGRRKGQEDERWLWDDFARVVCDLRPRYVVVENTPGLLSKGMHLVTGRLAELGYDAEWACVPAAAVGAPHLRKRLFIVAYTDSSDTPERGERATASGEGPRRGDVGGRSAGDAERQVAVRGAGQGPGALADSRGERRQQVAGSTHANEAPHERRGEDANHLASGHGEGGRPWPLADPECSGLEGGSGSGDHREGGTAEVPAFRSEGLTGEWLPEPDVGRVAYGVSSRVDRALRKARLQGLGNAVVPQVAEYVARCVAAHAEA